MPRQEHKRKSITSGKNQRSHDFVFSVSRLVAATAVVVIAVASSVFFVWSKSIRPSAATSLQPLESPNKRSNSAVVQLVNEPTWTETDDPSKDGWNTEAFANLALGQLNNLGNLLNLLDDLTAAMLTGLVADDF